MDSPSRLETIKRNAPRLLGGAASIAFTFLGLLFVTFLIARVVPIDPVLAVVGDRATDEVYQRVRVEMGLDRPMLVQFWIYLTDVLRGDLGMSNLTARPVAEDIARVFPATLELATLAVIMGVGFGVPLGVWAAAHQDRWQDQLVRIIGLIGYSVPIFWLGLVGLLLLYARWELVAGPGRIDIYYEGLVPPVTGALLIDSLIAGDGQIFFNALSHIILPASLLGYFSLAYISRMTRNFMLNELAQEYVITARVKGLPERSVIWGHAFANIRVPLLTVITLSYAGLLEGSVLTETVFVWPGLGSYITNALFAADMNAVLGGTLVVGAVFVGLNLLADSLYTRLDPRTQ
jgi:peptide/nickel transport system permease protein